MTPLEIAAKAYYEMQSPYGCPYEELDPEFRAQRERLLRAAFLAFADAEPGEPFRRSFTVVDIETASAYIRAAANEKSAEGEER